MASPLVLSLACLPSSSQHLTASHKSNQRITTTTTTTLSPSLAQEINHQQDQGRPGMAPPPPRRTAAAPLLLLSSLLLLFSVAAAHAAREASPAPASRTIGHAAELQEGRDKEVVDITAEAMAAAEEDHPCGGDGEGGGAEQEECLMRRTLVAHTDYIYTQGGGHN